MLDHGTAIRNAQPEICRPRSQIALGALCAIALIPGCGQRPPEAPEDVLATAERGPLKLTVEARPREAPLGDPVTLAIRMTAPAEFDVRLPEANALGQLRVTNVRTDDPRATADGGREWRRTFTLEPLESGPLEVPPVEVAYGRRPAEPNAATAFEQTLATEPLRVEIRSALTSQDTVQTPRDITGTLTLPPRAWTWREWTLAALAALAAVGVLLAIVQAVRRIARRPRPPLSPEAWALAELDRLAQRDWFAGGLAREFYYGVSEIVRGYVERQFGVKAVEMTTQEFLTRLMFDRSAVPCDTSSLRAFLEACDLVKYAALDALREDGERALDTARTFVQTTAESARRAAEPLRAGGRAA